MGASPPTEELTAKSGNRFLLRRRLCGKVKSRIPRELPCGESLRESRMREIRMSGLTRGEGIVISQLSFPPLLYRFHVAAKPGVQISFYSQNPAGTTLKKHCFALVAMKNIE